MFSVLIVTISITIILLFSNCSDDQAAFSSKQVSFHPFILTHSTNFCRQNRRPSRAFAIAAALSAPPPSPPPLPRVLFHSKSSTMVTAGAIRRRHLPDGGIQWLQVKHWMCSIERCAPHRTATSAWSSKRPAISLYFS